MVPEISPIARRLPEIIAATMYHLRRVTRLVPKGLILHSISHSLTLTFLAKGRKWSSPAVAKGHPFATAGTAKSDQSAPFIDRHACLKAALRSAYVVALKGRKPC